jgi:hypothetical protein
MKSGRAAAAGLAGRDLIKLFGFVIDGKMCSVVAVEDSTQNCKFEGSNPVSGEPLWGRHDIQPNGTKDNEVAVHAVAPEIP